MRVEADIHHSRGDRISLVSPYTAKDLIRTIPGARWSKDDNRWSVPLAWTACLALRAVFKDDLQVGDDLSKWAWARKRDVIDPAMALREALDAPGDDRLYDFQRAGVEFLVLVRRALLADEMGSGKTVQAILALRKLFDSGHLDGPILIVCPNTMKRTWERELRTWWGDEHATIAVVSGTAEQRRRKIRSTCQFTIINWEALRIHSRLAAYGSHALKKCVECGGSGTVKQAQCEVHERELNEIDYAAVVADECFTAGVKIQTPDGERNIEDLRPGDAVWGYDHATESVVESRVTATMHRESGCVVPGWNVTPNHPFYVVGEGYRAAGDLTDEDVLYGFVHQDVPGVRPGVQRVRNEHATPQVLLEEVRRNGGRTSVLEEHTVASDDATEAEVRVVSSDLPASVQEDQVEVLLQVMQQQGVGTSARSESTAACSDGARTYNRSNITRRVPGQRPESVPVHDRGAAVCGRETRLGEGSQWRLEETMALTRAGTAGVDAAGCGAGVDARVLGQAEAESRVPRPGVPDCSAGDRSRRRSAPQTGPHGIRPESHTASGDRRVARHPLLELRGDQRYLEVCAESARPDGDTVTVYSLTTETGNYFANDVLVRNCHKAKDPNSMQTRALRAASGDTAIRFGLTGTPIANDPTELWPILNWLDSQEWPTKTAWVNRLIAFTYNVFGGMEVNGVLPQMESEFRATIEPRMRRMPKAVVLPFLPPIVPERRDVEMNPAQKKAYDQMRDLMIAKLDAGVLMAANPMVQVGRLMQLASSYGDVIVKPDGEEHLILTNPSSKLDSFMGDLDDFGGQSTVVFAQSRQLIDLLSDRMHKKHIGHGMITGAIGEDARNRAIDDFQRGAFQFILCTIAAGGVGITLTKASVEAFIQRSWSPVEQSQAIARAHRIGSEEHDSITVVDYVTPGTVEEAQIWALKKKGGMLEEIVRDADMMRKFLLGDSLE